MLTSSLKTNDDWSSHDNNVYKLGNIIGYRVAVDVPQWTCFILENIMCMYKYVSWI